MRLVQSRRTAVTKPTTSADSKADSFFQ
jgi:hypothetical protein